MTTATPAAEGAPARERAIARALTGAATLGVALAAAWGCCAPLLAGHDAATASVGIVADNMLRWHVPWPVWSYTAHAPSPDLAYGHHPFGVFWTTTALVALFGRGDLTCRLAPMILSTATVPLLYALASRLYRPLAGAAAAMTFAALPITLSFAAFNALEVPVIAWSVLACWGFVGLCGAAPRRREIAAFFFGCLAAVECDWPGYLTAGALALAGLLGCAIERRRRPLDDAGRLRGRVLLVTSIALVAALVGQLLWLRSLGKLGDLFASYDVRAAGHDAPLIRVLAARRFWLELSFTKLGLALAAWGAPLFAWRAWRRRSPRELVPLALGATATIQYVVFRQGADVHVFWPQHFTPFIALTAAALVATALDGDRRAHDARGLRFWAVAALTVGAALTVARDGVAALVYARSTGGRFDEKGLLIHSDADRIAGMRRLAEELPRDATVDVDVAMRPHWSDAWALARPMDLRSGFPDAVCTATPAPGAPAAWLTDVRRARPEVLDEIAGRCAVRALGPLLVVTPGPWHPIEMSTWTERAGSPVERALVASVEPVRELRPDPFGAWEQEAHRAAPAPPGPRAAPSTVDELRIAHGLALLQGDAVGRETSSAALRMRMRRLDARFSDGTRLLGVIDPTSPGRPLRLVFEAGGPLGDGVEVEAVGHVVLAKPASLTMPDPHRRQMAMPPRIRATSWRVGWLYDVEVFVHPRPGLEEVRVRLASHGRDRAPTLTSGAPDVLVAVLDAR